MHENGTRQKPVSESLMGARAPIYGTSRETSNGESLPESFYRAARDRHGDLPQIHERHAMNVAEKSVVESGGQCAVHVSVTHRPRLYDLGLKLLKY
jgi:hypothetical protein